MSDGNVNGALGDLAMIFDITPTWARSKLQAVEAGTPEFDYMLATLVFDLVRKNALAHRALRSYLLHADPELTRTVLEDIRSLEPLGQDYETLARVTEERMLEVVGEVAEDHEQIADIVARWHGGGTGGEPSGSAG